MRPSGAELQRRVGAVRLADVVERAQAVGLRRIHVLAWRDLDDPEAGGSELHAHRVASAWAAAGLDVTVRTSLAPGFAQDATRDGYRVVRKAGRYAVFPRSALSGLLGRDGARDGLVEIWNGMPFFSPLWARGPHVVFLHHVHAEMWQMVLPPKLARLGAAVERRLAPPFYRGTRVVTLSGSSRDEIVSMLGLPEANVSVVAPGVDPRYVPGGQRSADPLVVAVGRLVPVKRFDLLVDILVRAHDKVPNLRAMIVGEGYERPNLEAQLRRLGAESYITLAGRVDDDGLLEAYRQAWVLASVSKREGWGMTITEAAACGTPAVATRIAGHEDAVADGQSGLLVEAADDMVASLVDVLTDSARRRELSSGALRHAGRFTWEATAAGTLDALVTEAERRADRR